MQKIVIDTNVLVSSLIQQGYPYLIVAEAFGNRGIEVCLSDELFEEYVDVLNRKKFGRFPRFVENARTLLLDIETLAKRYSPARKLDIISDKDDNKLLELAETSQADFLITGNHNDFTMQEYMSTRIVSPKEYWDLAKSS